MSLRSYLRCFIDALEVQYASLPPDPPESQLESSPSLNFYTLRPRLNETRVNALEELRSLVHLELQSLLLAQNSRCRIMDLPVEIIVHIFRLACLSDIPKNYGESDEEIPHELLMRMTRYSIATTCSYWRDVILEDPLVWRSIHLPCISGPRRSHPAIFDSIDTEIERCGEKTLFLNLETNQSEAYLVGTLLESISERIEELTISWSEDISIAKFGVFDGEFSLQELKTLHLCSDTHIYPDPDDSKIGLSEAFSLRQLGLTNTYELARPYSTWTITPPYPCMISHVNLWGYFRTNNVVELLNSCTGLESLVWCITDSKEELHNMQRLEPMPNLRHLRFGGFTPLRCLAYIHAPNLRHLRLSPDLGASLVGENIPAVTFSGLTSLIIDGILENTDIQTFLQNHCSLRALELMDVSIQSGLVRYLTSTTLPDCLAKLETLTIKLNDYTRRYLSATLPHTLGELLSRPASDTPFRLRYRDCGSESSRAVDQSKIAELLASYPETFSVVLDDLESDWEWP